MLDSWMMVLKVDSEGAVGNGVSRSECVWRALESPNYRLVLAGYAGLMCYGLGRVPTCPAIGIQWIGCIPVGAQPPDGCIRSDWMHPIHAGQTSTPDDGCIQVG